MDEDADRHEHSPFDDLAGGNRAIRQPIVNRFAKPSVEPILVPQEHLEQFPGNYSGAIGTPVEPQQQQQYYYGLPSDYHASAHSRRTMGGAQPLQGGDMIQESGPSTLGFVNGDVSDDRDAQKQRVESMAVGNNADDGDHEDHDVLAHLLNNYSFHDVLRFTEDNVKFSRRFYIDPSHSFFNMCMFMTFIAMLMSLVTAFIAVVIVVCEVEIDLYWYRTIYVILIFGIGLGIVAITTLHVYRNKNFSKDHVVAITLPALVFVVGAVMCGFGLQWYVSTHGTTIHWHSASQMSVLACILLMNWSWGIIMIPLCTRAIACHYVPEQVESQVAVEIAYTKDEINASATIRNSAKIARRGMGSGSAQKQQ